MTVEDDGTICRYCDHVNAPEAVVCAACGKPLSRDTTLWKKGQLQGIDRPAANPQALAIEPDTLYLYVASGGSQAPLIHRVYTAVVLGRKVNTPADEVLIDLSPYHAHALGVSRRHARIAVRGEGSYTVEDLDSANGTWLNGNRLQAGQPYVMRSGDHIQLGELVIFLYFDQHK